MWPDRYYKAGYPAPHFAANSTTLRRYSVEGKREQNVAHLISEAPEETLCRAAAPAQSLSSDRVMPRVRPFDAANFVFALALSGAVATWFLTIRSAFWLDETISYWEISGGLREIWARQDVSFPAYFYILWATKAIFGSSEAVLRIPSVLAMLAATYVAYRIGRELFSPDVAAIVTVLFCLHPIVAFEAVDARPYAFAVLLLNCAILSFFRWMKTNSTRYAILFGSSAAGIFYFHYLFGVVLPAFALAFIVLTRGQWRRYAPKLAAAGAPFLLMMLPVIAPLLFLFRTSQTQVYESAPELSDLVSTVAPGHVLALLFVAVVFTALMLRKMENPSEELLRTSLLCFLFAVVPLMFLYDVSALTSVHVFVARYRLVAVPGVALCWGFLVSCVASKKIRVGFCAALALLTFSGFSFATLSTEGAHGYSWKYALQVADKSAAFDHAPLLICSDLTESNFQPMPADVYKAKSPVFAPIFYYRVHSRIVPLPRALNGEAMKQVNKFLATATPARERFLVLGYVASKETLSWITERTKDTYVAHNLGMTDGVTVTEYAPR